MIDLRALGKSKGRHVSEGKDNTLNILFKSPSATSTLARSKGTSDNLHALSVLAQALLHVRRVQPPPGLGHRQRRPRRRDLLQGLLRAEVRR